MKLPGTSDRGLAQAVRIIAAADADKAVDIARGVSDAKQRAEALAVVAEVIAGADPRRAEQLVLATPEPDPEAHLKMLVRVAQVISRTDRRRPCESPPRRSDAPRR